MQVREHDLDIPAELPENLPAGRNIRIGTAPLRLPVPINGNTGSNPDNTLRPNRDRKVSVALQAYALMTTSAARGAVRDLSQLTAGSHKR